MKYALVVLCFFLMGFKPNLEEAIVIHQRLCEDHTKTQYACIFVVNQGKRYAVIRDRKGDYQIWQHEKEWVLVWSRLQT